MSENGLRTAAQKASVVEGYRFWTGTQRDYAASLGLPLSTVSRWLLGVGRVPVHDTAPLVRLPPRMLEVVPVPASPAASSHPGASFRLMLGEGVGLVFDTLPSASWVAELAAELRRC